jgi:hypothetical protein
MYKILFIATLLFPLATYCQKIEKVIISHEDPYKLYECYCKDSTTLFYEKIVPPTTPIGALVILPG